MSPRTRRVVITLAVLCFAAGVVLVSVVSPSRTGRTPADTNDAARSETAPVETIQPPSDAPAGDATPTTPQEKPPSTASTPPAPINGLHAKWVVAGDTPPEPLGSPSETHLYLEFNLVGAGLDRITLGWYWETSRDTRRAAAHHRAVKRGDPDPPPLPDDDRRYVLQTAHTVNWFQNGAALTQTVPILASHSVVINGASVPLIKEYTDQNGTRWCQWAQTGRGVFEATILDGDDKAVARVSRRFEIADNYDITITQRVTNLTDTPLEISWIQYGPSDLVPDRARYIDMRRFRFGYQPDPVNLPDLIISGDTDFIVTRQQAIKRDGKALKATDPMRKVELLSLWPTPTSTSHGYKLSWFASTNRYFALAIHPALNNEARTLTLDQIVSDIRLEVYGQDGASQHVFTGLTSPVRSVAPGQALWFDLGVYAGPLDRSMLAEREPMATLRMYTLILYQMSTWCAICTFQWLAIGLLWFLSLVHGLVADWGLAIILLVGVVRTLLHPLTKKAQVNMQRFSKAMTDLKPEIEKLQKKYPDDPKKLQKEQMRMMRERGVNPFQFLGCLPMFLQMPIWIALYAMLYFAIELRHEPAFWGFFQLFWDWPFLSDLSAADHFFWEFNTPRKFLWLNVTGINALPILMGLVFFFQQKYMSPPPSASMTKEQIQQQKMMKVMMVVMFPVLLYSAPSGLTLYIFTSSLIGIIESRYVRRHIKEMDLAPPKSKDKPKKKPKDLQARMYANALERARQKRKSPPKTYKKRK